MSEKNQSRITLAEIQKEVKSPKGNYNSFGKYKYRSAEDIVESVKPIIHKYGFFLVLTDEIVQVSDRIYIKATAILSNGTETYSAVGYAREEEAKKGMDASQITGAASSYARKYSLNGLFAIDDTKDSDATNQHEEDNRPDMNDMLMTKLIARYNKGESDVFDKADKHYKLREKDLLIIKKLNNEQ
jgi:hypothetical protein